MRWKSAGSAAFDWEWRLVGSETTVRLVLVLVECIAFAGHGVFDTVLQTLNPIPWASSNK